MAAPPPQAQPFQIKLGSGEQTSISGEEFQALFSTAMQDLPQNIVRKNGKILPYIPLHSRDIPAIIIPIVVVILYAIWLRKRKTPKPAPRETFDEEKPNRDAEEPPAQPPPPRLARWFSYGFRTAYSVHAGNIFFGLNDLSRSLIFESCIYNLVGIVASMILFEQTKINPKTLTLGLAWLGVALRNYLPPTSDLELIRTCLSVCIILLGAYAVVAPNPKPVSDNQWTSHDMWLSRSMLLVVTVSPYLSTNSPSTWPLLNKLPHTDLLARAIPLLLIYVERATQSLTFLTTGQGTITRRLQKLKTDFIADAPNHFFFEIVTPVVVVGTLAAGFYATCFLSSCMPFGYFILGKSAAPPQVVIEGDIFAGLLFYMPLMVWDLSRQPVQANVENGPRVGVWHMVWICVEAVPRATVALFVLLGLLVGGQAWLTG